MCGRHTEIKIMKKRNGAKKGSEKKLFAAVLWGEKGPDVFLNAFATFNLIGLLPFPSQITILSLDMKCSHQLYTRSTLWNCNTERTKKNIQFL